MRTLARWLLIALLAVGAARPDVAGAAPAWRVFTLLGSDSDAVTLPWACERWDLGASVSGCPGRASALHAGAPSCVTALEGAAFLVCSAASGLARIDRDGSIHPLLPQSSDRHSPWGQIADVAATRDGGIVAVSDTGLWSVTAGQAPAPLANVDAAGVAVERLPDDSMLVADGKARVVRVGTEGVMAIASGLDRPCDVAAAGDSIFVAECRKHGRIRRIAADGTITTVAGTGRRWREGARATTVDLGPVSAVDVGPDGTILIANDSLLSLRGGRIRTLLRLDDDPSTRTVNAARPPGIAIDGELVSRAAATVFALDALPDGTVIAAGTLDERYQEGRVMLLAATSDERLAVSLPTRDRVLVHDGKLEVRSTRAATARLEIRRGGLPIAAYRVTLRAGVTRMRVRPLRGTALHTLHLVARTDDGDVAEHRLGALASRTLGAVAARRALKYFGLNNFGESTALYEHCRRVQSRRWRCDHTIYDDVGFDVGGGTTDVVLRADGLLAIVEDPTGGKPYRPIVVEPR